MTETSPNAVRAPRVRGAQTPGTARGIREAAHGLRRVVAEPVNMRDVWVESIARARPRTAGGISDVARRSRHAVEGQRR